MSGDSARAGVPRACEKAGKAETKAACGDDAGDRARDDSGDSATETGDAT